MSQEFIFPNIIQDLKLKDFSVKNTVALLQEGATIPFIARYRKEKTGSLDETQIKNISEKLDYYTELENRRQTILKTIEEQGKLTPELKQKIRAGKEKQALEDLYLPYKPKKRTKAIIAKEKGLKPLAGLILKQDILTVSKEEILATYVNQEKGVTTGEEALSGALDIVAEDIADIAVIRGYLREYTAEEGLICSKAKKEWRGKKSKFEMYYDFSEKLKDSPSHRILAIHRGNKEGVLAYKIEISETKCVNYLEEEIVKNKKSLFYKELLQAIYDSFKRLIFPSMENEVFNEKLKEAEKEAITVFSKNLHNLLLMPPAGYKVILGVDPGFRTGCKLAVIDSKGDFKEYQPIFPHPPQKQSTEAERVIIELVQKYKPELVSIGNGTASKETRQFLNAIVKKHNLKVKVLVVSEAGASVYSASGTAQREFPDLDVTIRGAISIARRLQDPLAELVKIEPKSIGVGQYQHDVNQAELKKSLDVMVESCVNHVGVELNTASLELLSYVSGIGKTLAENIINYKNQNGHFENRRDLLKVFKLGGKAFEQCAGFLRIRNSRNPLDNSAIHPESYAVVEKMADDLNLGLDKLISNEEIVDQIKLQDYVNSEVGLPTLTDIVQELKKPGLDPRKEFSSVEFSSRFNDLEDLKIGLELAGTVTNVTNFGAFVDIGVHQDGLIHISKLSSKYVKNPYEIVAVGDTLKVKVLSVDLGLRRISLAKI